MTPDKMAALLAAARDYRAAIREWESALSDADMFRALAKKGAALSRIITAVDEMEAL